MDTESLYPKNPNGEEGRPKPQSWIRGWWRETLAVGLSLWCTLCIALLLFVMKNRPLAEWAVPYISLPAALSILTTISKSTTALTLAACISQYKWIYFKADARKLSDFNLLDHASRGPNGALFLILAKGPLMLASLGTVTTILSLSLEPSVQQILNLAPIEVWVEDGKASFPISRRYEGGARGGIYAGWYEPLDSPDAETVDIAMQAAMYNGLFNLTSRPAFSCPSGSCRWLDSYVSLGFQSNCTDVTTETFRHWEASPKFRDGKVQYNMTTPGRVGLDLNIPEGGDEHPLVVVSSRSLLRSKLDANRTTYTIKPSIARIAVYRGNSSFPFRDSIQPEYKNITECDITLVAYRYSEETIPLEPGVAVQWPTAKSKESKNNILGFDVSFYLSNRTDLPQAQVPLTAATPDLKAVSDVLTSKGFTGQIIRQTPKTDDIRPPEGVAVAFLKGDISETIGNMAKSMTQYLVSRSNVTASGQSGYQVVHILVRWEWLALPVIVQIMSVVFFVIVVHRSSRTRGLELWKDSSVALLSHDVTTTAAEPESESDDGVKEKEETCIAGPQRTVKELDKWADGVKARVV